MQRMQYQIPAAARGDAAVSTAARRVLRNTYFTLALTMIPTAVGAVIGTALIRAIPSLAWVFAFAPLLVMIPAQIYIHRNAWNPSALYALFGFTFLMGMFLGNILAVALTFTNGPTVIMLAAGMTGAVFFSMSALATVTRRDLGGFGKMLMMGMWMLLIVSLVSIFFPSLALYAAISAVGAVIFSLFIFYDINRVVRGGETNYVVATTHVYISIWAVFQYLLHLLLMFAGNRE